MEIHWNAPLSTGGSCGWYVGVMEGLDMDHFVPCSVNSDGNRIEDKVLLW